MDWSGVDYCDVFISCLDSHSDGTHSLQRIHCHHVHVTSTGVNSSTARVYLTDSMNTTPMAEHQTASSGKKTITPAKSGRKTTAHKPRNLSRRARGSESLSRGSSLRSGSFDRRLRLIGTCHSTRANHRTRKAPMLIIRDYL